MPCGRVSPLDANVVGPIAYLSQRRFILNVQHLAGPTCGLGFEVLLGDFRDDAVSFARAPVSCDGVVRTAGIEPAFPFEKQIFLPPRLSPPPDWRSWSGLSLRHSLPTVGAARLVSTPSPKGLGSGLA
jgi:hypothetical protein